MLLSVPAADAVNLAATNHAEYITLVTGERPSLLMASWQETTMIGLPNGETSSFAVAEWPRDALCPSVVSLNKITRAESFIIVT